MNERPPAREPLGEARGGSLSDALARRAAGVVAERYRAIVETAIDAIVTMDADGVLVTANPAAERMFRFGPGELAGRCVEELMPEDVAARHGGYVAAYLRTGEAHIIGRGRRIVARRADGSEFHAHLSVGAMRIDGQPTFTGIVRDLTVEHAALEELARSDERFRAMLLAMGEGVVLHDADGSIAEVNRRAAELLGVQVADLRGRTPFRDACRRDGSAWPVEEQPHLVAIRERRVVRAVQLAARRPDGLLVWLEVSAVPLRDEKGRPVGAVTTFSDVTSQQRVEREQAALRLVTDRAAAGADETYLCGLVAREARSLLGVAACAVTRFDGSRGVVLAVDAAAGVEVVEPGTVVPIDAAGATGLAYARGATTRVDRGDATASPDRLGDRVAVPLGDGGGVWGALVVAAPAGAALPPDTEARLEHFARVIEIAVAEADARRSLHRHALRQSSVAAIGQLAAQGVSSGEIGAAAIEQVPVMLGGAEAALVLRRAGEAPRVLAASGRLDPAGRAALEDAVRAATHVPLRRTVGTRHELAAPVRVRGASTAAIVAWREGGGPFDEGDAGYVRAVAEVVGAAQERDAQEAELRRHALHDRLTGLPNRVLLADRLAHAIGAVPPRRRVAVLFCDLDRFKEINDAHGHGVGDALLAAVAQRARRALAPGDTLARFGGDELVVVRPEVRGEEEAIALAEALLDRLAEPVDAAGLRLAVGASVGVALVGPGASAEEAIRDADTAMYRAKASGRGRIEVFDVEMRARMLEQVDTDAAARHATARGELELHYQPIVALPGGRVRVLEALVRWRRPGRGLAGPQGLIAAAERTGAIVQLGRHVLATACREAAALAADRDVAIAVNVSPHQLADEGLPAHVAACLEASALAPGLLALELTESALLEADETHRARLAELRGLGVRVLLDDFGSGYSSLGYLRRLPLDGIKLDRAFVAGLGEEPEADAVVDAVVQLAHALALPVTAEGVETAGQAERLAALGCELAQGFWFSRPCPIAEAAALAQAAALPLADADGAAAGRG